MLFLVVKPRNHRYTRRHRRTISIRVLRKLYLQYRLEEIKPHLLYRIHRDEPTLKSVFWDTSSLGRKQKTSFPVRSQKEDGFWAQSSWGDGVETLRRRRWTRPIVPGHSTQCRDRQYRISPVTLCWSHTLIPKPLYRLLSQARKQAAERPKRSSPYRRSGHDRSDPTLGQNSRTIRSKPQRKRRCTKCVFQLPTNWGAAHGQGTAKSEITVKIRCSDCPSATRPNWRSSTVTGALCRKPDPKIATAPKTQSRSKDQNKDKDNSK